MIAFIVPLWLQIPLSILGLAAWSVAGLMWLSWLTDRHFAGGRAGWWPAWWQIIPAGPLAWILFCIRSRT